MGRSFYGDCNGLKRELRMLGTLPLGEGKINFVDYIAEVIDEERRNKEIKEHKRLVSKAYELMKQKEQLVVFDGKLYPKKPMEGRITILNTVINLWGLITAIMMGVALYFPIEYNYAHHGMPWFLDSLSLLAIGWIVIGIWHSKWIYARVSAVYTVNGAIEKIEQMTQNQSS
jgi:hypothetical protein